MERQFLDLRLGSLEYATVFAFPFSAMQNYASVSYVWLISYRQ